MRFQILGPLGWPVRDKLIPVGQICDLEDPTDMWGQLVKSVGVLPPNCIALDQDAWNVVKNYDPKVRPAAGPDVKVE
jgi:hypothetical protein